MKGTFNHSSAGTGTLVDFFSDVTDEDKLKVEVAIKQDGRIALFHNKPFKFNPVQGEFSGEPYLLKLISHEMSRDHPLPIKKELADAIKSTSTQLLLVRVNTEGKPLEGNYIPLICPESK